MENQAPERTQGYSSRVKPRSLNKRQRAATRKFRGQEKERALEAVESRPSRVLVPVENVPGNRPVNSARGKPEIVKIETITRKIGIVRCIKVHSLQPPAIDIERDKILCGECKKQKKPSFVKLVLF